ncbi:MAG: diheme cytochrome C [Leptolyngbyaceae cyanobacterium RM2_2_4]|nr:diheme cytochrome C [Leptolyngbyaceae cyanobacterium SM1_4_3]NJN92545.1 diheme cytochrome C [Leptolyngbyaceae cyanobacterium SL_5_14]NJO53019.1 diheme cytochrome C [Leptolyngbyaceae cyanobacterium RM2_2_4]
MVKSLKLLRQTHPQTVVKPRPTKRGRSPVILFLMLLLWSLILGWGLAQATESTPGTVDAIAPRYELGQELYLENCATCHIGVPPGIMPTETWRQILQDPEHYGVQLPLLVDPPRLLVWDYLRQYSRPEAEGEQIPFRIENSRYFKALHPRVELPQSVRLGTCISCHPAAEQFNFRSLSPEWEDAP